MRSALRRLLDIIVQPFFTAIAVEALRILPARYNGRLDPMSLLQAEHVTKSYGAQDVLRGVSVTVPQQARIALVGPNGVGKSTLLRALAAVDAPDSGRIQRAKDLRLGYLPQEAPASALWSETRQQTLWQVSIEAFAELQGMQDELARLEEAMADPRKAPGAMDRYGRLQEDFERSGGYTFRAETERVLRGLGFEDEGFLQPLAELSGGERTRALLARLLLEDPDLLVLDEPTNHLDFEAIEWLEGWLAAWPGAAILVSHDRYFLDETASTVWDLSGSGLEVYRGNYSQYIGQREARRQRQRKVAASQRKHIEKEREYIRRNIAGQNTRQAQGRRKRLERFMAEEAMEAPAERRQVAIDFEGPERSGDIVVQTKGLAIGRSGSALFQVPDIVLQRGERAAVLGPNGAGKSTFLKTLIGEIQPAAGEIELGANVEPGYFAQAHEELSPAATVLEAVMEADRELTKAAARDLLGRFRLSGDDVEKRVEELSGGERGKLALARLTRQGANLLLLDEPTNHLDVPSQEVLQEALAAFEGTILLVSHDRYLIDGLGSQVWIVHPERGELEVIAGGYQAYRQARRRRQVEAAQAAEGERPPRRRPPNRSAEKKARLRMERIEGRIEELEGSLEDLSKKIEAARNRPEEIRDLGEQYAALEAELQTGLKEWEELARRLERA